MKIGGALRRSSMSGCWDEAKSGQRVKVVTRHSYIGKVVNIYSYQTLS